MNAKQRWKAVFSIYRTARNQLDVPTYFKAVQIMRGMTQKWDLPDIVPHWQGMNKKGFPYVPTRKFSLWIKGKWEADCQRFQQLQERGQY